MLKGWSTNQFTPSVNLYVPNFSTVPVEALYRIFLYGRHAVSDEKAALSLKIHLWDHITCRNNFFFINTLVKRTVSVNIRCGLDSSVLTF